MFRIGEFAKLVRVSQRMLRHYEKCGLLTPAAVDPLTGYRQYSAAQIALVTQIVTLRDLGFSIEEIGGVLPRFADRAFLDGVLAKKSEELRNALRAQRERLQKLEAVRSSLKEERLTVEYEVVLKQLPAVKVLSLRDRLTAYDREGELWARLGAFMAKHGIACPVAEESGYSIYHDDGRKEEDVDVEIAVPVAAAGTGEGPFTFRELEAVPLAATLRFAGPYEGYSQAIDKLATWIEENGYQMRGVVRGAAIRTAADQSDPQNYLTELQIAVEKK